MIQLGIIGTNWITHQFVEAALATKQYRLQAVYSRKLETAQAFGQRYEGQISYTNNFTEFMNSPEIDTIYIASPNSLHFEQGKAAILAGKNVIVEKPAFSNPEQTKEIITLAKKQKVHFFEAARNIHEANFGKVANLLSNAGEVIGANFTFMKYSSRYDAVLAGEEPNIFSLKFSGGSLADLGVYPVYAAVAFFGKPHSVHHFARKVATGVDGIGTAILRYANFDVTIQHGKIGDAFLPSEIYTTEETFVLDGINSISQVAIHHRLEQRQENLALTVEENPMVEEASDFAQVILNPTLPENQKNYEKWLELAQVVSDVLYEMRMQADIIFAADKEKE